MLPGSEEWLIICLLIYSQATVERFCDSSATGWPPMPPAAMSANPDKAQMHKFISQIKLLYPVLDELQQPFVAISGNGQTKAEKNLLKFVSHVQANADKQLPFRDHARS
jgi:hypothetical protein